MIAEITGMLTELDSQANTVLLKLGAIGYEVMVPAYAVSDLSSHLNEEITFSCLEYYEGSAGGSSFIPRLIGFPESQDKAFFQKFISVKGIGIRKALRALAMPLADIAYSIEQGDTKMLLSLPEIGKRTAEQVVAELKGKMGDYCTRAVSKPHKEAKPLSSIEKEALEILLQLGEKRNEAEELIDRARQMVDGIETTDALVQAVYRVKAKAI